MSEAKDKLSRLRELVERNLSPENQALATETGLAAAAQMTALADENGVAWALAGGIALHLYGFTRATKDVDVIASAVLPLASRQKLTFGGESYETEVGGRRVTVDWIVRDDFFRELYENALADAIELAGWRLISPDWLAILKYAAGRPKDMLDLRWLLQQDDLIDLEQVRGLLKQVLGERGAALPFREIQNIAFAEKARKESATGKYQ